MGQHKSNPNCQKVKDGILAPKPKGLSKRERERKITRMLTQNMGLDILNAAMLRNKYRK